MTTFLRTQRFLLAFGLAMLLIACGGPSPMTQQTPSYTVKLTLDSTAVGDRSAKVEITDTSGQPVDSAQVILTPTMLSMGMASPEVRAQSNGNGQYTGDNLLFSMTGDWELDVRIEAGNNPETARFIFPVPAQ